MMKIFLYVTLADDAIPVRHIRFLIQGGVFTIARTSLTSVAFIVKEISDLFQILHVSSGGKKLFLIFEIIAEWATLGQGADLDSSACKGGGGGGVQVFHRVVHGGALLPTLLCSLQRYYPNITIISDGRICMFVVLLRFTLSFVYKIYIVY